MEYKDELERMRDRRNHPERYRRQTDNRRRMSASDDFELMDDLAPSPQRKNAGNRQREMQQEIRAARRKRKRRKRVFLFVELAVLAFLLVFAYRFFKKDTGYWNIAVFGVDSRDGKLGKGALADVDIICSINRETGEMKLVSVFRDSYLRIDKEGTYHKLNEAYFKGGPDQAIETLNSNLDLDIDDYVTFNWKAVADTINILGGIDLEITDSEFQYINSFITETVESTGVASFHLEHAGMNHLDGVQAVAYARLRLMDTDFNRTARQRKVISLTMEKAKKADFAVLNNILVNVFPQVSTSVGFDDLIPLAKNIKKYHIGETSGFPFAHQEKKINKRDCVIPVTLESNVIQLHEFLYGETGYQPSSTVKKISAKIIEDSGLGEPGKDIETNRKDPSTSGGQTSKPKETAPAPAPTETLTEEAVTEPESSEEETEETEETKESETETTADQEETEIGPGVNSDPGKKPESETTEKATRPDTTEKETVEKETEEKKTDQTPAEGPGPGSTGPAEKDPENPSGKEPGSTGSSGSGPAAGPLEGPGANSQDSAGPGR